MKKVVEEKFNVDGMSCHSCEKILKTSIKELNGVLRVEASFNEHTVTVKYNPDKIDRKNIVDAIEKEGYVLKEKNNNYLIIPIIIALFIFYLILKDSGLFNFIPEVNENMSLGILFIVGVLTSIHCIAMCGGINMTVAINYQLKNNNKKKLLIPGILYNLGRLTSYTFIGGIVGLIGSVISFNPSTKNLVSIIVGLFMILLGIKMAGIINTKNKTKIHMPKFIILFLTKIRRRFTSPYAIGLVNGLMPCGPLQSMQIYALGTGSFFSGALSMFFFALGTIPLMIIVSVMSSFLSAKMSVTLKKLSAIFIIFLGLVMLNRGVDIKSFLPKDEQKIPSTVERAVIKDGYQEVITRFYRGQYQPIVVQKGIPVKWIIEIKGGDLNGCNNELYIEEYKITKSLNFGDNVVEFTPNETGTFRYTCWMNMLRSTIYVVDSLDLENK